jgi:hypothetical protein
MGQGAPYSGRSPGRSPREAPRHRLARQERPRKPDPPGGPGSLRVGPRTAGGLASHLCPIVGLRSPLLVSNAMMVVIVRVKPRMLPPTMMIAPTSAMARPNAARKAVRSAPRPSLKSIRSFCVVDVPSIRSMSPYCDHSGTVARCTSAMTIGVASTVCAMIMAAGVNRRAAKPSGPVREQDKIERKPDDDRRQAQQRIGEYDDRSPPTELANRECAAQGCADQHGNNAGRQADAQRQGDDPDNLRIEAANQGNSGAEGLDEIVHPGVCTVSS